MCWKGSPDLHTCLFQSYCLIERPLNQSHLHCSAQPQEGLGDFLEITGSDKICMDFSSFITQFFLSSLILLLFIIVFSVSVHVGTEPI